MRKEAYPIMAKKWTGMDRIDFYCDKILRAMKEEDLTLLDLSRCAARFSMVAKLFQDTLARTQDELNVEAAHANKE